MTDSVMEVAVHISAAASGADAAALCDSASFMETVRDLGPDTPGFVERVAAAVRTAAEANPAYRQAAPGPAPEPAPRQWTMADVTASAPSETAAAMKAGLLRDLGYPPRRRRR